jgi:cell division septation protein DedD
MVKRLVIVLASIVLGVLIGFVLFVVQEKERESGEEVSMKAKMEPIVDSQELSIPQFAPQFGEFFGEKAMEFPHFLEAEAFLSNKKEAGPIEEPLIEPPIREETKVPAIEEDPKIVTSILEKKNMAAEAMPAKEILPSNKMLSKLRPVAIFTINVASFRKKENADRYVDELKEKNLDTFAWEINLPKKKRWYRVSVGSFSSRQKAKNYREKLIQKGISNTWITEIPESL